MENKKSTRPIGRPMKHGHILNTLEDERLYTPAMIAAIAADPLKEPKKYRRIRNAVASFSRRHYFKKDGDGKVRIPGQGFRPAWFGATWKEPVPNEDRQAPTDTGTKAAASSAFGGTGSSPGRPMRYAALILSLEPFQIHSPHTVAESDHIEDLFSGDEEPSEVRKKKFLARKSMQQFCKKLPPKPDGIVRGKGHFSYHGWYGWRWQICLPDSVLARRKKRAILIRAVHYLLLERSRRLQRKKPEKAEAVGRKLDFLAAMGLKKPLRLQWLASSAALVTVFFLLYFSVRGILQEARSDLERDTYIKSLAEHPNKKNMKRMVDLLHEKSYHNQQDLIASKLTDNLWEVVGREAGGLGAPPPSPETSGPSRSIKPSSVRLAGQPLFASPDEVLAYKMRDMDPLIF